MVVKLYFILIKTLREIETVACHFAKTKVVLSLSLIKKILKILNVEQREQNAVMLSFDTFKVVKRKNNQWINLTWNHYSTCARNMTNVHYTSSGNGI